MNPADDVRHWDTGSERNNDEKPEMKKCVFENWNTVQRQIIDSDKSGNETQRNRQINSIPNPHATQYLGKSVWLHLNLNESNNRPFPYTLRTITPKFTTNH
jgi:hypothetical protein